MIKLPTEKSGIDKRWNSQKFLMMGMAGIGKSDFWQYAKKPLFIGAEQGLNFIDACKVSCTCWDEVEDIIFALLDKAKSPETFPYDVVITDTIDRILMYAEQETMAWACTKYSKGSEYEGIGDIPGRTGWYIREKYIDKYMKAIEMLPCAKVLIGHVGDKEIEELGQKSYHKRTINIGGKVGANLLAWADHTLHISGTMVGDKLKRIVYTKPTQSREAKSRGGIVKDGWVWTEDGKENFDQLRKQFT